MNPLTKYLLLTVLLMVTALACANVTPAVRSNPERCDHEGSQAFLVEVILDKHKPTVKPDVKPKAIVACFQDTIEFKWQAGSAREEFDIVFDEENPYMENLKSNKGVANGKVKADPGTLPSKKPVFLKYRVKAKGRPDLDPRIIITPR